MLAAIIAAAGAPEPEQDKPIAWLWPCNVQAWCHWCEVQTQWRVGMGGATGLDYAGVTAYLRDAITSRKPRTEVFEGIRAAERATLGVWAQQREDNKRD